MNFVAGIDGGQSSTAAVIGNERGRIVGRGQAGPSDEVGAGRDSTRLRDALAGALRAASVDARLPDDVRFSAVVAGISGYAGKVRGRAPDLPAERVELLADTPIAHAGALGGAPGVVVIAGTGSAVYATGGETWSGGGWGYLFGDEGSAFWVVRKALTEMMRREDAGEPSGDDARAACDFFALPSLRAIARSFYGGELSRAQLAAFAPAALRFPQIRTIAERGADHLARLVHRALSAGAAPTVAGTGGLFEDRAFALYFEQALRQAAPSVRVVEAKFEPQIGALLLAYRLAELGPFETIESER